jgi:adenine deaminase
LRGEVSLTELKQAVEVAVGRRPGTLLLTNAKLLNVFTLEVEKTHILLAGRLIAGAGELFAGADAEQVIDLEGRYVAPGLIDGHVHIESSLVTPASYAEAVVPRGVTGVVCDPHEIGNVAGVAGIEWLIDSSEDLPLSVWSTAPSCVPSTPLETSGAVLGLGEIETLLAHPRVVGVAEIMSFPAVIAGDDENLSKALLADTYRKPADGHAPSLSGRELQAYLATGIASDHESTTLQEGLEKLRAGMFLMIREGSVTRGLDALMPLIEPKHGDRIGFVTDDRLPHDLLEEGGVDVLVRRAIAAGVEPAYAVRCGSFNTARYFGLSRRGAVAAGYFADLVVLEDLARYHISSVYNEGRLVAAEGRMVGPITRSKVDAGPVSNTVSLPDLSEASFRLEARAGQVRCIRPVPEQLLTEEVTLMPTVRDGEVVADPERDLLKLACVERYGKNGGIGVGLVTDFGLKEGALASTVGHDHHNVMAVGVSDGDLLSACRWLERLGGGFVVVKNGEVLAELALPIAGLLSDEPLSLVQQKLEALEEAASSLGAKLPSPFMTLSFLGLAVIPELRLTDMGLVDVFKGELVPFDVDV